MWKEVIKKIRDKAKEGRELSYMDGAIGITSLLQCPLKWELSQRYDIKAESVEIDDGFVWERQVKDTFKELFGSVEEEKDLIYEVDGYRIHGHLDLFVENSDDVIGIELKSPKFLLLREIPKDIENGLLLDDCGIVIHNPQYYTQAMIERFLLERLYPEKKVRVFLFYKALCRHRTFSQKLYVVSEVKESIKEEELRELLKKFHEDKSPRYPNECESYCVFYKEGLCEGRAYTDGKNNDGNALELLKEYRALQSDLKLLETHLKKAIRTSLKFGNKEIGWVKREVKELDIKKILALPLNHEEYLTVKWQRKDELIKNFGEELVKEVREEWVWRL